MTYGIGIGFPLELTEKDMKKLKRDLAYDKFGVVDGGNQGQNQKIQIKIKQNPPAKRIEVHSGHRKLVVRDLKTGQYAKKR